jgi:DNA-directed RNA polymerase specialized sigma24 family protein
VERETAWTLIRSAAADEGEARETFSQRYWPVVRAYLAARWRSGPLAGDVEDATQEVFLRCFRPGGPLERAEESRTGGFQAYLQGVCRNVARGIESRRAASAARSPSEAPELDELPGKEERLTVVFDRAFAREMMREARTLMAVRAEVAGHAASKRLELLRMRFEDGLPIRTIAEQWQADAAQLHHEYALARQEFHRALLDVVADHHPERTKAELEAGAARLLEALA